MAYVVCCAFWCVQPAVYHMSELHTQVWNARIAETYTVEVLCVTDGPSGVGELCLFGGSLPVELMNDC